MKGRVTARETSVCFLDSYSRNGLFIPLPDGNKRRVGRRLVKDLRKRQQGQQHVCIQRQCDRETT